jgi:type IV secretory pathway VirB2 component (pilin)
MSTDGDSVATHGTRRDESSAALSNSRVHDTREGERSAYGELPGEELPKAVYATVIGAFAFIVLASWAAFGGDPDSELSLGFATVLTIVFFALPIIVRRMTAAHSTHKSQALDEFLHSHVETATGPLTGSEACMQILIIPLVLAFAAVAIGAVYILVA